MQNFNLDMIDDPSVFKVNVLPARSDTRICGADGQPLSVSLNGMWKFHYASNPASMIAGFEKPEMDVRGWKEIPVPSNIQMQGYDVPAYVNTQYPWDGREELSPGAAPRIFNPTAQYVTFFELPKAWKGQEVRICFHGVESGFALWLNGSFAGYSEDSFTPSEFDLTPFLQEGVNRLAVLDFKFTGGSWFEDQDMFRLSGIFRDVELYPVPAVHLEDVRIKADLDGSFSEGILDVEMKISGKTDTAKVGWALYERGVARPDPVSGIHFPEKKRIDGGEIRNLTAYSGKFGASSVSIVPIHVMAGPVNSWSAEVPYLYELELSLRSEDGQVIETASEYAGFRHFEMKDGIMCLNGKRIVFNGVNRHEFSCDTGRSPRAEDVENDIRIMKRNNINAIRTCHYPNASYIYRLADLYGLYMIAETNMETHGSWCFPGCRQEEKLPNDHKEYLPMLLDRVRSQFERDKNHPAILIWSLGNESYGGLVIFRMSELFRQLDNTRLVHYEGIMHDRRYPDTSDMESQMYTSAADVERFLEEHPDKPFILCEYTHSMGNSNGGMHRYIELSERNPRYQGGFIWDFVDQAVRRKNRYGEEYLAYGGDCLERPTDYEFSGNGIIDATRRPYGKIQEIRYNYRTIRALVKKNEVTIVNKNLFIPTNVYDCQVKVEKEGRLVFLAPLKADVKPLSEKTIPLPCTFSEEGEYAVTVSFHLKEDTLWEKKGYEVAFGQSVITVGTPLPKSLEEIPSALSRCSGPESWPQSFAGQAKAPKLSLLPSGREKSESGIRSLTVTEGKQNLGVRGEHFEVLFSALKGGIASYRFGGRELIDEIPRPNFWRAPVSNDAGNRMAARLGIWKLASDYQEFSDPQKGIFDTSPDENGIVYPKISRTEDYVEIIWKKFLPVLCPGKPLSGEDPKTAEKTSSTSSLACATCLTIYRVFADGTVRCILDYDPKYQLPPMPEFGWMFVVNADYSHVTYYGNGPEENYCDRKEGVRLGVYSASAKDMVERYLVPQETGNRTGVRWAKITDKSGHGVMVSAAGFPDCKDPEASLPGTMEFSAIPYSPGQLENARHPYELPPVHKTYIRCALKQMGVAGDDSWGARPHPEYMIPNDRRLVFAVDFRGI